MADRLDATVDAVQPTAGNTVLDGSTPKAQRLELTPGYNAMLASRQLRDSPLPATWAVRCIDVMQWSTHVLIGADEALRLARSSCRVRDRW